MTSRSYHQTTYLTQKQLSDYELIAQTQDQKILNHFARFPVTGFSCDDIELIFPEMLITSIRRALTDLADSGNIVKTGQRTGKHGRPVNVYLFVKL
jgi:hypothetical protein